MNRRAFLLLGLPLAAAGCATAPPRGLAWRTLAKGVQSGITTRRRRVFRADVEWYAFWPEHAVGLERGGAPPAVDFAREMVVAVTLGTRPTGGHAVSVVGIGAGRNRIVVQVEEFAPRTGALVTTAETAPYHFIALPRSQATVRFNTIRPDRRQNRPGGGL
ncbi:MAG TPA: protease complex subunit PrcB family protein [Verrucomicrobiota bacterium]|nr:protease complex subunit PrcB family protein [Verrucomicrobiota bacterium]